MLELVCGKSAGASLKMAAKRPEFAEVSRDVVCLELALSVGSLRDCPAQTGRAEVLRRLYGAVYPDFACAAREQAQRNRQALERLRVAAESGEPVRVWTACAGEEWCLFLLAMSLLQSARGPVSAVCVPLLWPRPDGTLCSIRGLGELSPERWCTFLPLETPVDPVQRSAWANLWQMSQSESAPLRVMLNGSLAGVPEDFFDGVLRQSMPKKQSFTAGDVVGRALVRLPGVLDAFLAGRLRLWTQQGLLRVHRTAEYYYETVLERTDA
ncbi:DUF1835 domain-containing protein [uncultured Ruthenibacterium sp.]|uniref:DUF1835 domain-containing protein n=1 Tax=uncultured Ruthenibacterium sp. TaxID=1905347 RepID=UPI00349E9823